jgi:hypothetical protein
MGVYPQDGDFSTADRFVFTRCFSNPFDSTDIATYDVVVSETKVHGHTLGVITAYWDGYHGWDAPWWADFYAL